MRTVNSNWTLPMISPTTTSWIAQEATMAAVRSGFFSAATKSPGSIARINDVQNADTTLKKNTTNGELMTLGTVATFGAIIRRTISSLETKIPKIAELARRESWLNLGIAVVSSGAAEIISRKFYKRAIDDNHHLASNVKAAPSNHKWDDNGRQIKPSNSDNNPFAQAAATELRFQAQSPSYGAGYPQSPRSFTPISSSPFRL